MRPFTKRFQSDEIDLRDAGRRAALGDAPLTRGRAPRSIACTACGRRGHIDVLDVVEGRALVRCLTCDGTWTAESGGATDVDATGRLARGA